EKQANADYATHLIGKWHISGATPQDLGFDSYDELRRDTTPEDPKGIMARSNAAVSFVEQQVAAEKPFFLQLSEFALHQPIRPTPENVAKYENLPPGSRHTSVEYAAYTEDLDTGIGNLLDRVDALGIRDNTYVIFASDNGSSTNDSRSTPLFSGKKSIFEGGIRSPLIISGPGIDANSHSAVPVTTMDLYSTVSDLVGNATPFDVDVEGASLKALLENGGQLPDGTEYLQRAHAEQGALYFISPSNIASGSTYRLRPMAAVRQGDYKLVRIFGENGNPDEDLLFNMSASVEETETVSHALNLARIEPEVASELGQRLDNWIDSADVPLPYNVASDVTVQWLADQRNGHRDVVVSNEWRATTDIKQKFRETWYQSTSPQATPRRTSAESYQRSLPTEAFTFDGDDR
ncbi:MAG: sulfatase-like hydrolase/transferase, partial [Lacipirellulaceae bacterium]